MRGSYEQLEQAGPGHPWVRTYLRLRRADPDDRRVVVEGAGLLHAARAHGADIEVVLACPELWRGDEAPRHVDGLRRAGVPVLRVSQRTFARLSLRDGQDGICAIARPRTWALGDLAVEDPSCVLVLDRVELPGNVGSMIRCASASGVACVLVTDHGVRLNHPTIVKASVGAVFSVPTVAATSRAAVGWLRAHAFTITCADPSARDSFRDVRFGRRAAVVVGSERHGLSDAWRSAADHVVTIPMRGRVDSLNAGHAGAVLLFEVLHQQDRPAP